MLGIDIIKKIEGMIYWEVEKSRTVRNTLSDQPKARDLFSRPPDSSCPYILAAKVIFRK